MKKFYMEPEFKKLVIDSQDVLTVSGEEPTQILRIMKSQAGEDAHIVYPG